MNGENPQQDQPCENEEMPYETEVEHPTLTLSVNGDKDVAPGGLQRPWESLTIPPNVLESSSRARNLGSEALERERTVLDLTPAELATFCVTLDVNNRWHQFFKELGLDAEVMQQCKDGHAPLREVLLLLIERKPTITVNDLCRLAKIQTDGGNLRTRKLLTLTTMEVETLSFRLYSQLGCDDTLWKKVATSFDFSLNEMDYIEANFCSRNSHSEQMFRCLAAKKPKTLIEEMREMLNNFDSSHESPDEE